EDSDDLSLVAVMEGVELKSRSQSFKGGSMLAWFGGIELDLSEAELAPDARLSVRTLFGGIAIDTPPDLRIESSVKTVAGGGDTKTSDDPDAPVLAVEGMAVLGGIAVGASRKPSAAKTRTPSGMD